MIKWTYYDPTTNKPYSIYEFLLYVDGFTNKWNDKYEYAPFMFKKTSFDYNTHYLECITKHRLREDLKSIDFIGTIKYYYDKNEPDSSKKQPYKIIFKRIRKYKKIIWQKQPNSNVITTEDGTVIETDQHGNQIAKIDSNGDCLINGKLTKLPEPIYITLSNSPWSFTGLEKTK